MIRRNFIQALSLLGLGTGLSGAVSTSYAATAVVKKDDRKYWVDMLTRVVRPVLEALKDESLRARMPVEAREGQEAGRRNVTYLEALGRSLAGLAPWLELGPDNTAEGKRRKEFIELAVAAIDRAVDPGSADFMNFDKDAQPLVDAAFLAHALLRAPTQLWGNLTDRTKENLVAAFKRTRVITPYYSNWLLFTAMIEAALLKFTKEYDAVRIDYALKEHESWYLGDGVYGDGPHFHFDYYNSYVIQPMLIDIAATVEKERGGMGHSLAQWQKRATRYAAIQERLISPEGTFPPIGRSIAYRCGAFQVLAQMTYQEQLPKELSGAQVRSALTAVIRRSLEAPDTFDKNGWLTIGFCGHQPDVGEYYISTGSLYLCTVAFLPLGLKPDHAFWTAPAEDWTSKKAYAGKPFPIDHAI